MKTLRTSLLALLSLSTCAALDSNEEGNPQILSNFDSTLCAGRSSDCAVELDVPSQCVLNGSSACPIVLFLHGSGGSIDWFDRTSGVHENAMIGIYPNGDCRGWNTGPKECNVCEWDDFSCVADPDEGDFVAKIIAAARVQNAVGNVYVRGNSNGAALAHRLASNAGAELPISGIVASVTQLLASPVRSGPGELNYNQPRGSQVSVLTISGTGDGLIPYNGGTSAVFGRDENFVLMSNEDSNQAWATLDNCSLEPSFKTVTSSKGSHAVHYEYPNCDNGKYVEHYMVVEGGHDSGGATLAGKDASDVAFDFIRKCEDSGFSPPQSAPVSAPTICQDDASWHGQRSADHNCNWVAGGAGRCNAKNEAGVPAWQDCPVACNMC